MNILIVGGGGREHAITKKVAESNKDKKLFAIPGNPGIGKLAEIISTDLSVANIIDKALEYKVDLIICGPEQPLVDGLTDLANEKGILVFGPNKKAAQFEGSKIFAKQFMKKYQIPTADFKAVYDYKSAEEYIFSKKIYPLVIKADGLAAGKGVKIVQNQQEALFAVKELMVDKILGSAGDKIIFEEYMVGEEMSSLFITDGKAFLPLIEAKDYKRAYDNDEGGNTGGMGSYAPHTSLNDELRSIVNQNIIQPIKKGLKKENIEYRGVLYIGLMLTDEGPKVVEFNCRFGDPETQVILPLMENDFIDIALATVKDIIHSKKIKWKNEYAATVVIASGGYPGTYEKDIPIEFQGIDPYEYIHAGTKQQGELLLTNGGRVLNAVATGASKEAALNQAYQLAKKVQFNGAFYRNDIGK
ncbi:MAG: phosphoribosylamine--glycine ligase [Spirochaetes bacterium]|nr:phosphoribosylamine--glycine ligase [Spirochaetota bacterium]